MNMFIPHYWAVVPAAGSGRRFSSSTLKQYSLLQGKPVVSYTLQNLLAVDCLSAIVYVHGENDVQWQALPEMRHAKMLTAVGGAERADSVRHGLLALQGKAHRDDWVLVHDAARPCCFPEDIRHLIECLQQHSVGGLFALPMTDTVKRVDPEKQEVQTIDRSLLWRALTPQMFRYGVLMDALSQSCNTFTDESQSVENLGLLPQFVTGKVSNLKITHADDLALAEFYIAQREQTLCE